MMMMNLVQVFRACRSTQLVWRASAVICKPLTTSPDSDAIDPGIGEHIRKQILQAGLHNLTNLDSVDKLRENVKNRDSEADIEELVSLYKRYKDILTESHKVRKERDVSARQFINLKSEEERAAAIKIGTELKQDTINLENEKVSLENKLLSLLSLIPNHSHPDTPIGGYDDCRVIEEHGEMPEYSFPVKDHIDLNTQLGIFDFQAAAEASGNSFYYLEGAAAMLELALIQLAMNMALEKGYHPVLTPDVIRTDLVEGCGFHPRGPSSQVYHLSTNHDGNSTQCLSGTAEIPLAGKFTKSVIPLKQLPIRLVAFGRCFRAEVGSAGHAHRGLYRVHQFSKVELFGLTAQEEGTESQEMLEEFLSIQKELLSSLGLHYRVLEMATGELGAPAYRKYDIEAWMPGREEYGEVTSASNCTDYQSRRLLISYPNPKASPKSRTPKKRYVHTVNGTACAVPRVMIALLEHYQQEDGSVLLPEVLRPYLPKQYWHIRPL